MPKTVHVIGNGDSASFYNDAPRKGLKLACNLAPFPIENLYASCMVDFKMMKAIHKGGVEVPGEWILGARPKVYMEKNSNFHMQRSHQIKMFYTRLPSYAANYTDLNCGHMAVYFAAQHLKADVIHMYGFDSIFDFNLRSYTDVIINSDRGNMNNNRLANNWRPLWQNMFKDFNDGRCQFVLHHMHDNLKFKVGSNVAIETYGKREEIFHTDDKNEKTWVPPASGVM
jgi:hypothetical protein